MIHVLLPPNLGGSLCGPHRERSAAAQALQRVAAASGKVGELLGAYVGSLFGRMLQEGFDLGATLLPAMMHAISTGPRSSPQPVSGECSRARPPFMATA